jgi:hypothetical protein
MVESSAEELADGVVGRRIPMRRLADPFPRQYVRTRSGQSAVAGASSARIIAVVKKRQR